MVTKGDYMLLSPEVASINPEFKNHTAETEVRIWHIRTDNIVCFKAMWDSAYGQCTREQAEEMHQSWTEKKFPALRKGPQ